MNAELYREVLQAVVDYINLRNTHGELYTKGPVDPKVTEHVLQAYNHLESLAPICHEELAKQKYALQPDIPRYCKTCGGDLGHGPGPLCCTYELKARELNLECVWYFTDDMGHYETDCGASGENHMSDGMDFCPYCGLPIRVE